MATAKSRGSVSFGSQEYFDYFCQPCGKDGAHLEAEGYCEDCREFLCKECYSIHRKPSALRSHVLVDKHCMKKYGPPSAAQGQQEEQCGQHKGKLIEYFCTIHENIACTTCLMMKHRTCDPVLYIPDESANFKDSKEYKDLTKKLTSMESKTNYINDRLREKLTVASDIYNTAINEYDEFRKEVIEKLDDYKEELIETATNIRDAERELLASRIDKTASTAKEIQHFHSELKHLESSNRLSKLFIVTKQSGENIRKFESDLGGLEIDSDLMQYHFVPNQQIKHSFDAHEGMGTLKQSRASVKQNQHFSEARVKTKTNVTPVVTTKGISDVGTHKGIINSKNDSIPKTPEYVEEIYVRSSKDVFGPLITGIAKVTDKLVLCDFNCKKIKLVSLATKQIIDEWNTGDAPRVVAESGKEQVVVTVPDAKKLLFMNVTNKLSKTRELKFTHCCYGVACMENKLALTFSNPAKVDVYDINGKLLHTIQHGRDGIGIFGTPTYVAFAPDGQALYVSDEPKHAVVCVSMCGVIKKIYKDDDLRGPQQMVLDDAGNMYVCARWSENVLVISLSSGKARVFLDHDNGLMSPRSIFLCQRTNTVLLEGTTTTSRSLKLPK